MITPRSKSWPQRLSIVVVLALFLAPAVARADLVFQVTVNNPQALSSQTFGAGAPYALDFTLTSGGNTNTATISNFSLGGGSADSSTIFTTGGASGDINSPPGSVSVTDNASLNPAAGGFNDFNQVFTPGSGAITFDVDLTTSFVSGTPDRFTFSILDMSGSPIPTSDSGNNNEFALLGATISGAAMTLDNIETYTAGSGSNRITISVSSPSAVPEPSPLVLIVIGGIGAMTLTRWGQRQARLSARISRVNASTDLARKRGRS
jgi:hypothetical protein